jgi:hypothetical protein
VVTGGAAYQLFWKTEPKSRVVANAPWNPFIIAITDQYGNTAPSSADVTVNISGGNLGTNCTNVVAAVSGEAQFTNFTASSDAYPRAVFVTGTAPGISVDTGSFGPVQLDEKYTVNLNVKDSVSSSSLPEVTLQVLQGSTVVYAPPRGNSPFAFQLPYGNYTINLDKEKYVQSNKDVVAGVSDDSLDGTYDNVINWTVYMMSMEEATADYQVKNSFVYDETLDKLSARLWLERRGKLITNTADSVNKLGDATIQIFDEVTNDWMPTTLTIPHPAFNDYTRGVFRVEVADVTKAGSPVLLVSGKTYFARCTISYGGADGTGKAYETGTTFTITVTQSLKAVTDEIKNAATAIGIEVAGVKTTVAQEAGVTRERVKEVKGETQRILATTEALPGQITTETGAITTQLTTVEKSQILNRETAVMLGSTISIRYRTYASASPVITIYDPANVARVAAMPMTETTPGIYEYAVTFASSWPKGDYSIVCSEPNYGTLDAMTITAGTSDIESVSSDVSAVLGSVTQVRDIKKTVDAFSAAFDLVEQNIQAAAKALSGVKAGTQEAVQATSQLTSLFSTLKEMSAKIHEIGGTLGYDLEKLYDVNEARSKDIGYIRNKTQELKALMLLNQELIESAAKEEPVVQTWFEFR